MTGSAVGVLARPECAIRVPGGTLVLAPPRAFGSAAAALRAHATERLRRLGGDPHAIATLRRAWSNLGLPGMPDRLSEREVIDLLGSAVAAHRLAVAYFPQPGDPEDRLAGGTLPRTALPTANPAKGKATRDMSRTERIEAALRLVPKHLTGPLKDAFLGLISPTSIGITVAAFAGLAVAQFFGYGEVADAVLAGIAYGIAGLAGVRALYYMVAATLAAATATSDAELDAAATRLAEAFVVLGVAFLTIFITRAARKAAQSRAAAPEAEAEAAGRGQSRPARRPAPSSGARQSAPSTPGAAQTGDGVKPVKLLEGQQGKHIVGSNNYDPGRSTLTAEPNDLLQRFAGKGQQIGKVPVGQAGSKESFDAGEIIGTWRNQAGQSSPTTRAIIHYAKDGAHIIPATPKGWIP